MVWPMFPRSLAFSSLQLGCGIQLPPTPAVSSQLSFQSLAIALHVPACAFCAIEFHPLSIPLGSRSSRELQRGQGHLFKKGTAQKQGDFMGSVCGTQWGRSGGAFPLMTPVVVVETYLLLPVVDQAAAPGHQPSGLLCWHLWGGG